MIAKCLCSPHPPKPLPSVLFPNRFQTSTEARLLRSAQSVCGTLGSAPLTGPTTISTAGKTRYSPGKISAFSRLYLDVCGLLLFYQQRGNVVLVSVRVQRFFELSSAIDCRMAKTPQNESALLNLPSNARPRSAPVLRAHRCFFFWRSHARKIRTTPLQSHALAHFVFRDRRP